MQPNISYAFFPLPSAGPFSRPRLIKQKFGTELASRSYIVLWRWVLNNVVVRVHDRRVFAATSRLGESIRQSLCDA